jgi:phosphate transport system substrate-binding protein
VDFGASDAAMSDEEIGKVDRGVQLIPMTAGSIVLSHNLPDLTAPLRLSRQARGSSRHDRQGAIRPSR